MLDNRDELLGVLGDDPRRIGKVFARHAYGMRRWVDLFSIRVPLTCDPLAKQLLAEEFHILPFVRPDLQTVLTLQDLGCAAIRLMASPVAMNVFAFASCAALHECFGGRRCSATGPA